MKLLLRVVIAFTLFSPVLSFGQACPPPGFPNPGFTCQTAPVLCPNLDGYCVNTGVAPSITPFPIPGCGSTQYQFHNPIWFGFIASTTTITMQIVASNCMGGNNGIQAGIYDNCISSPMDLQCACSNNFQLTANNFVPGEVYWFFIDGCSGSDCDISIDVTVGSTAGVTPADPGPITGPITVCANSTTSYSITPIFAATNYAWTVTPAIGTPSGTNPSTNITWSPTASGTADVCVTVSNACFSNPTPSCTTVTVIPVPTATLSGSGILCSVGGTPVDLTVTFTGEGPWTFVPTLNTVAQPPITTNDNPYTFTVTQAGNWGLQSVSTVTGSCPGTVSGSATVTPITITPSGTPTAATCGQSNGAINLSVTGGTAPYMFEWSNSETTEDLADIPGGAYTVTVTDDNGCTGTASINVGDNPIAFSVTGSTQPNTTCIGGNGAITTNVNPAGTYMYEWSNSETTTGLTDLTPGTYTVTVTTGVTCTQTASFTIQNMPNEPVISSAVTPTTCELPNGAINVTVSGGVTPYTFEWGGGEMTEDLANIPSGTYSLTVTGDNGCTDEANITVSNNNPPFTITPTIVANTTCNGGNGSITLTVTPAGTYTFEWFDASTNNAVTDLTSGSYAVTVSAGGACTQAASFNVPDQPNAPNITSVVTPSTCELANGGINVSVSGGVTPYTFEWGGGEMTEDLANIPAGTYSITVTGANGCTDEADINVSNNNPPINISAAIVANTACTTGNGSITLTVTPAGSYTFLWGGGGETTSSLTGLMGGTYDVTVSAGGACTDDASFTIPDIPNAPNITFLTTPGTCELPNGAINVSVSGGVSPYSFLWNGGQMTEDLSSIPAGAYSLVVTGANGCTDAADIDLDNNNPTFNVNPTIVANTNCNGVGNGSVTLSVSPPGAYSFEWYNAATTNNQTQLLPGSYMVTVSAGGACTLEYEVVIPDEPNAPELNLTTLDAICDQSNGSVNLTVSGSTTPYSYEWSSGQTTQDLTNVPPDTYFVTVTGGNGCTSVDFGIVDNALVNISINDNVTDNTSCLSTGNGAITLLVFPANVTITWSTGAMGTSINQLLPGDYDVTVTAGGSCVETQTFTVSDESVTPDLEVEVTPGICGISNGAIDLTVSGGPSPYAYQWSNGAFTQDISNLAEGDYTVVVSTALGCTNSMLIYMPNNQEPLALLGTVFNNTSCSSPNGSILLDVIPEGYTYQYNWSNTAVSENLSGLTAGMYTVSVTLGNCSAEETFEVGSDAAAPNLSTTVTPALCGLNNGSATANASGGQAPYTYKWSNNVMNATVNNLAAGSYTVTVTGANGCTRSAVAVVPNNSITIDATATITPNTSCLTGNGAIDLSVTPAGYAYTYQWSNSAVSEDLNNIADGVYTVTVTHGTSCSATASFTVLKNTVDPQLSANVTAAICGASNGAIDVTVAGASGPYQYNWNPAATTEDLSGIISGNYSLTVTAANGCTAAETWNVANNSSTFSLSGTATPLTNCASPNGAVNLTITPPGTYQIIWSNSAVTEDLNGLPAGIYDVTVVEQGNCAASASFIVEDQRTYPTLSHSVTPEFCGLGNGAIDLTVGSGLAPFTYQWAGGQVTEDLSGIPAGPYEVTVSGANGCTATLSANIVNNSVTFSIDGIVANNTSCTPLNGAIDLTVTPPASYQYLWSTMATTEDINAVDGGSYSVTVSAGGTCTAEASFEIIDNTLSPLIAETVTPSLCGGVNGAVALNVSGSTTPYAYLWTGGATTPSLSPLLAGDYFVTVTGGNGCSSTSSFTVPDNVFSPTVDAAITDNNSCTNPNGAVQLTITPTNFTYTAAWSIPNTTGMSLSNLSSGMYTVTVSAGGACTTVANIEVEDQTPSPDLDAAISPSECSQPNGDIDLTVTGAFPPYQFVWSNGAFSEDVTGLLADDYAVTVTAANGCTATANYTVGNVSNNFVIAGAVTAQTSCASPNGAIAVTMVPAGAYTYQWSNSALTEDINGLNDGTYTVTVTDASGCAISETFTVNEVITPVTLTGTPTPILCFGDNTGAIDVGLTSGVAPYSYQWNPAQPGNPQDLNNILAGTYQLTVTDQKGCTTAASWTVTQPATGLALDCDQTQTISAPGESDGEGTVTVAGGTAPYSIQWTPGSGNANNLPAGPFAIGNLAEGAYNVTVTDANGCSRICGFSIGLVDCTTELGVMGANTLTRCGPGCLAATYNPTGQALDPEDLLRFVLHEGASNQIVNPLAFSNNPSFCFNASLGMTYGTTYYVSAVAGNDDGSGNIALNDYCTVVSFGQPIVFYEKPEVSIAPPATLNCAVDAASLVSASSINGVSYAWSGSGTLTGPTNQSVATAAGAGIYRLIIDTGFCADTAQVQVNDLTNYPEALVQADPSDILDCVLDQIILSGTVKGSNNANTVWLVNGVIFSSDNPVPINEPGDYAFVVLDTLSLCTDTAFIQINQNQSYPPLQIAPPATLTCSQTVVTLTGSSPFPNIGFRWATINGGDTTYISQNASAQISQPGEYFFIGFDLVNGCTNIDSVTVTSNTTPPTADAGLSFLIDCFGETLPLQGSATGAANLTINWTTIDGEFQSGQQTLSPLITQPGTYTLLVTNPQNGCTAEDSVEIPPDNPVATLEVTQPPCYGDRGRIHITQVTGGAPPVTYSLNGGAFTTQSDYPSLPPGTHTITIQDSEGCSTTVTETLIEPAEFIVSLTPEVMLKIGDRYLLEATVNVPLTAIESVRWTPTHDLSCDTCLQTWTEPLRTTRYEVHVVTDQGCEDRASVFVYVDERIDIYAPNIFDPGSTENGTFTLYADPRYDLKIKTLQVYSRWGEMVFQREGFEPNNPALGWDGTHRGEPLNPAVFVWYAVVIGPGDREFVLEGNVTVTR